MKKKIKLTQENIYDATVMIIVDENYEKFCPIARSLQDAGYENATVCEDEIYWIYPEGNLNKIKTPNKIHQIVKKFDEEGEIEPCNFYMPYGPSEIIKE